ncbi:hypothetical protein [Halarcobacter sp.]|uniref:hypothetical protein n=1 Tax=Halarcobacter sp. TaxID=2321133 RepID=UPI0029F4D768|nr:hypothetical protein [Halarcobacter sp.]
MDINKFTNIKLEKKHRIILMIIYAVIMFISIQAQMGLISFIILFAVLPIVIFIYVKKLFPKKD